MKTSSTKIEVKGRIHIGRELELVQGFKQRPRSRQFYRAAGPDDGSINPIDNVPFPNTPGRLDVQQLGYSFSDLAEQLYIEDDGLCPSYGIFGVPGSGKTHLLLHLLGQILKLNAQNADLKYGALILDPKAQLIEDVRLLARQAGREDDVRVLSTSVLNASNEGHNVIDCAFAPRDLAALLVLAAQSAGTKAKEEYWFNLWKNFFEGAIFLLRQLDNDVLTLRRLLDAVLIDRPHQLDAKKWEREIQQLARDARRDLKDLSDDERQDAELAINAVESFFRETPQAIGTVETLMRRAFGAFQLSKYKCYSPQVSKARVKERASENGKRMTFYDEIINDGKIVVVGISPDEGDTAKALCTLVKCLFQQTVLSRFALAAAGDLHNVQRPVIMACDEYSQIASEMPGTSVGDGNFFSLARQFGCMGLLATQSVPTLEKSALGDAWKSIFSNFGAKIFMRLGDNETIKEAAEFAGKSDWFVGSSGRSFGTGGQTGISVNTAMQERDSLRAEILANLKKGEAVVMGSLDGGKTTGNRFARVPAEKGFPYHLQRDRVCRNCNTACKLRARFCPTCSASIAQSL